MKKLVAIAAISALLITGNISFALGTQPADKPVKNMQVSQIDSDKKDIQKKVQYMKKEILTKRQDIIDRKAKLREAFLTVKNHIKELRKDNKDIDTAELSSLLKSIKSDRLLLNNVIADYAKEIHELRMAKKNGDGDIEKIKEIFENNIIPLQTEINKNLETIQEDLGKIDNILKERI